MSKREPIFKIAFLHPQYWPIWLGIGLLRLLIFLPYQIQVILGKGVGRLGFYLAPKKRQIAEINLRLCLSERSPEQRLQILRKSFESAGIALFETAMAWWGTDKRVKSLLHQFNGLEHIRRAQAEGRGVLLFIAHFTPLHLAGRLLADYFPFTAMSRRNKNPVLDAIMTSGMSAHCQQAVVHGGVKQLLRKLKDQQIIWYAADLNVRRQQGIFIPFFGIPAATVSLTSRLARATNAAVIPFFFHRRADGCGYDCTIYPALENYPTQDIRADTLIINQIQEAAIRKQPEQYLWAYKRFKTRPEGEPSLYENA